MNDLIHTEHKNKRHFSISILVTIFNLLDIVIVCIIAERKIAEIWAETATIENKDPRNEYHRHTDRRISCYDLFH